MFFWIFITVSPIFSTLLLLKEFKKNIQVPSTSQQKGSIFPSWKA